MNERIRKLMAQAGFDPAAIERMGVMPNAEKFAELIVQECFDVVANADMTELEGPDPEDVLYVACKQIKEHFGVE